MGLCFSKNIAKRFIIIIAVLFVGLLNTACSQITYLFGATEQLPFKQKWTYELKEQFNKSASKPAPGPHNTIIFLTADSSSNLRVQSMNSDGTMRWSIPLNGYSSEDFSNPFTVGPDGSCYVVGLNTSELSAISPNGKRKWSRKISNEVEEGIAAGKDGTVLLSVSERGKFGDPINPKVMALDANGKVKWEFTRDAWFLSKPVIAPNGTIYFTGDNGLYALTPDGKLKWRIAIKGSNVTPTLSDDGTIYICSGGIHAIRPDGTQKWFTELNGQFEPESSIALARDGTIYTASWDTLYALDNKGRIKWKFGKLTGGDAVTGPVLVDKDGTVYFSYRISNAEATRVYAINPDGTKRWDCGADIFADYIAIGEDGTKYVLDLNNLKAYSK